MSDDGCKRYLFEYRHDGAEWRLEIPARDLADAKDRLKAIPWAQYRGEVFATVRIPRTLWRGLWGRITACFGNVST